MKNNIIDIIKLLKYDIMPYQEEILKRISEGEKLIVSRSRSIGWSNCKKNYMLWKELNK